MWASAAGGCLAAAAFAPTLLVIFVTVTSMLAVVAWRYGSRPWRHGVEDAVRVTVLLVGLVGWLSLFGGSAVVYLLVLLLLGSPVLLPQWLHGRHGAELDKRLASGMPDADGTPQLSALCQAWADSYVRLGKTTTGAQRVQLVAYRHQLLDEIERRDPEGFARWLRTASTAGGSPSSYLHAPGA